MSFGNLGLSYAGGFQFRIIYKSFIRVHGEVGSKIKKKNQKFCFQIIMKDCHFF